MRLHGKTTIIEIQSFLASIAANSHGKTLIHVPHGKKTSKNRRVRCHFQTTCQKHKAFPAMFVFIFHAAFPEPRFSLVEIYRNRSLLYFFLGLCDYSDKFPKMFCSSSSLECPSTANFCHQCGQQLNLSQVSNKAESSVNEEKLLTRYFHRGYPYAAWIMCTSDCGSGSLVVHFIADFRRK